MCMWAQQRVFVHVGLASVYVCANTSLSLVVRFVADVYLLQRTLLCPSRVVVHHLPVVFASLNATVVYSFLGLVCRLPAGRLHPLPVDGGVGGHFSLRGCASVQRRCIHIRKGPMAAKGEVLLPPPSPPHQKNPFPRPATTQQHRCVRMNTSALFVVAECPRLP